MSEACVFYNPRKGSCPMYIQADASAGLIKPTKDLIENFGGLIAEDPQKAIVVVIIDRNTYMGSKLITEYTGEFSGKGVVDQAWVLESIRQGRMLGPPDWGGYALHKHTVQTYFDQLDENTSGITCTASSTVMNTRGSYLQCTGNTPLQSPGPPGSARTSRTPAGVPRIGKSRDVRSSESTVRESLQGVGPTVDDDIVPETSPSEGSPAGDDKDQSSGEESNRVDSEPEDQSSNEPPPEAPPRHNLRGPRGTRYTDTDKEFIFKYWAWAKRNGVAPNWRLYSDMAKLMPWHSAGSIYSFTKNNSGLLEKHYITSQLSQRRSGRKRLRGGPPRTTNVTRTHIAEVVQSAKIQLPTTVKDVASGRVNERARKPTSLEKGKAPSSINEAVIEAMVLFLKDHPDAYRATSSSQKRGRLWSNFAKLHPNHSAKSYYQYHVEHHKELESAARKLTKDEDHSVGRK